jgi:hypothetical protein
MWRIVILLGMMVSTTLVLRAESGSSQAVNAALVQVQDCLEISGSRLVTALPDEGGERSGLTLRSLFVTLAIGCLSILFCVPAALVAEYFSRRGDGDCPGTTS